jgi:ATP-dependent Clp protease ATP-binding subunit ClpC
LSSGFFGPPGYGGSPFDDFIARIFGASGSPPPAAHRVDITRLMSGPARELIGSAAGKAAEQGSELDTEHLLAAASSLEPTRSLLARAGADPAAVGRAAEQQVQVPGGGAGRSGTPPPLTPGAKRALLDAHQISRSLGSTYIGAEHILFALAVNPESGAGRILGGAHVTPEALQRALEAEGLPPRGPDGRSSTPTLNEYGRDLTAMAREGRIDPVIGRDEEIEQTIEVLSRRGKNNPVLIGEAGVGKTAIVEGIAQRIVDDEVPQTLAGKRVIQLELSGVVAGTRYRGDFEERLRRIIDEIREHAGELIVFIDELHTLVGAGGGTEGGIDAGNMVKPALARGELHIVGATTLDEYRKNIEKDAALARRFQPILVPEPTPEDTLAILHGLKDRYEAHHQVRFDDGALAAAVELSDRYISDRFLPDKAIDLIDQAGARVRLRVKTPGLDRRALERQAEELRRDRDQAVASENYEQASRLRDELRELRARLEDGQSADAHTVPAVTAEDIAEVVSRATGIPVRQLTEEEKNRLLGLEEHLHGRVIGQDDAVAAVAEAVRRSRAGLGDPGRPVGSFLFLGPTGVGKTELARALTEALFGAETSMIRLDMSEFQERHTVSRLVGAPPGYVGYDEAGQLTEAVRRKPYSVVLLDEVEKAHPDVFNILLQVLEDGRLTDGQGRTVDFKNTVLIMTSNVGSDLIKSTPMVLGFAGEGVSAQSAEDSLTEQMMSELRALFRPEFINRIDEIVIFRQLDEEQLRQITELLLEETRRRLHAQHVSVEFDDAAVDWIADHGYQPEFGARPMRRTIQREVDNQLSSMLLDGNLQSGQTVKVGVGGDDELSFEVTGQPATV